MLRFSCRIRLLGSLAVLTLCSAVPRVLAQSVTSEKPVSPPADAANLPEAIAKLKSGDFSSFEIYVVVKANATQAIPALEEQFSKSQHPQLKSEIASALIRLGDKNGIYWDFLEHRAAEGLKTDAPTVSRSDSKPGVSPEFAGWAQTHNMTTDSALAIMYDDAMRVELLAATKDPRAIPLLRRALSAPYFLTQSVAARGLVKLQDKDSIPLMIEACKTSPLAAGMIAIPLMDFDDPRAREAFLRYAPPDLAKTMLETKASEKP